MFRLGIVNITNIPKDVGRKGRDNGRARKERESRAKAKNSRWHKIHEVCHCLKGIFLKH